MIEGVKNNLSSFNRQVTIGAANLCVFLTTVITETTVHTDSSLDKSCMKAILLQMQS